MTKAFGVQFSGAIALFLTIFIIIYNSNICTASKYEETELYNVHSDLPHIGPGATIVKLRSKRQTSTDLKNQYQSVSQNATNTKLSSSTANEQVQANSSAGTDTSVVVPYSASDRPLLGVNGTGQRKNLSDKQSQAKPTIITDSMQGSSLNETAKKPSQFPKKVFATVGGTSLLQSTETPEEELVDSIDIPENDTITAIKNNNVTVNYTSDYHVYYNSTLFINKVEADKMWDLVKNISQNNMLSHSHRRAMTVELSFDFPFYGHPVRNITVATGGFLYTGEYVHSWLAATQYIAPLMANFDTNLYNESYVRISDNGTAFTVVWEQVLLQDKQDVGKFTFSTTLHKNGDIVFVYYSVPIFVNAIQDDKHPVKVGLSDAYIIDKIVYFARRKTIYEYHRVNFAGTEITNSTIIYLTALSTCLQYTDCVSCTSQKTVFDCAWCTSLNRCSTGTDRRKQEWLQKGCDRAQIVDQMICPALGQKGNNANQTNTNSNGNNSNLSPSPAPSSGSNSNNSNDNHNHNNNNNNHDESMHSNETEHTIANTVQAVNVNSELVSVEAKAALEDHHELKSMGLVLGVLVPICLVMTVLLWVLYGYRNPHTKSGQLLIQYRPSHWSWRRGEARYTAATIHM